MRVVGVSIPMTMSNSTRLFASADEVHLAHTNWRVIKLYVYAIYVSGGGDILTGCDMLQRKQFAGRCSSLCESLLIVEGGNGLTSCRVLVSVS